MSHSSFTASERRGILAIAFISLLLIAVGLFFSWCGRSRYVNDEPVIIDHSEMIDSAYLQEAEKTSTRKKSKIRKSGETNRKKTPKSYRRRSPLDEPV